MNVLYQKTQGNSGFTLIELLVTMAIVALLASIAVPAFGKYRERSYDVVAVVTLRDALGAIEVHMIDTDGKGSDGEGGVSCATFGLSGGFSSDPCSTVLAGTGYAGDPKVDCYFTHSQAPVQVGACSHNKSSKAFYHYGGDYGLGSAGFGLCGDYFSDPDSLPDCLHD